MGFQANKCIHHVDTRPSAPSWYWNFSIHGELDNTLYQRKGRWQCACCAWKLKQEDKRMSSVSWHSTTKCRIYTGPHDVYKTSSHALGSAICHAWFAGGSRWWALGSSIHRWGFRCHESLPSISFVQNFHQTIMQSIFAAYAEWELLRDRDMHSESDIEELKSLAMRYAHALWNVLQHHLPRYIFYSWMESCERSSCSRSYLNCNSSITCTTFA